MIYRDVLKDIEDWLSSHRPKCLVLRGARQVGKTTAIRSLPAVRSGKAGLCEVNLERHPGLEEVFSGKDTGRILEEIAFTAGRSPNPGDIVFLDEVQAAPSAFSALRYLAEDFPELRWAAAGSLLDMELRDSVSTVPVGRMQYLFMGPLSVEEFIEGTGDLGMELELLRGWEPGRSFSSAAHRNLCEALRKFFIVGGMPGWRREEPRRWQSFRHPSLTHSVTTVRSTPPVQTFLCFEGCSIGCRPLQATRLSTATLPRNTERGRFAGP